MERFETVGVIKNQPEFDKAKLDDFISGIEVDFPDFTRHLLAWKNSLLQTALEKHLQCDYVV